MLAVVELGLDFVARAAGALAASLAGSLVLGSPPWIMKPLMIR